MFNNIQRKVAELFSDIIQIHVQIILQMLTFTHFDRFLGSCSRVAQKTINYLVTILCL